MVEIDNRMPPLIPESVRFESVSIALPGPAVLLSEPDAPAQVMAGKLPSIAILDATLRATRSGIDAVRGDLAGFSLERAAGRLEAALRGLTRPQLRELAVGAREEALKTALKTTATALAALSMGARATRNDAVLARAERGLERLGDQGAARVSEAGLAYLTELRASNAGRGLRFLMTHPDPTATANRLAIMFAPVAPLQLRALRTKLSGDLGPLEQRTRELLTRRGVGPEDVERYLDTVAEVRCGFETGAEQGDDMQRTNWIHTRIELVNALEAADTLGLDRVQTLGMVYGTLFSDCFKDATQHSLLWHNRGGAELVAPVLLQRRLRRDDPASARIAEIARRVANEHQITPAAIMSGAIRSRLKAHLGLPSKAQFPGTKVGKAAEEIAAKVLDPLRAPERDGEIEFSAEARRLLAAIGVPGWAVPHASSHRAATDAAIAADLAQYAEADGIIKIAVDIRDPESALGSFARDARMRDAVDSSLEHSFGQWERVVAGVGLDGFMQERQGRMRRLLEEEVYPEVGLRLGVDALYWDQDAPVDRALAPDERRGVDRVKQTFREVMAEKTGISLDPFGVGGDR